MAAKNKGYAVRANGFFMTKKGEFMPLCDKTAVYEFVNEGKRAIEERLGALLPNTYVAEVVPVVREWIEASA